MRGRHLSASRENRRRQVEARAARRRQEEARLVEAEAREAAFRGALSRPRDPVDLTLQRLLAGRPDAPAKRLLRDFLVAVAERAPRLVVPECLPALAVLAELRRLRPVSAWAPSGKGRGTLFRSLAEHLLARYPMPRACGRPSSRSIGRRLSAWSLMSPAEAVSSRRSSRALARPAHEEDVPRRHGAWRR